MIRETDIYRESRGGGWKKGGGVITMAILSVIASEKNLYLEESGLVLQLTYRIRNLFNALSLLFTFSFQAFSSFLFLLHLYSSFFPEDCLSLLASHLHFFAIGVLNTNSGRIPAPRIAVQITPVVTFYITVWHLALFFYVIDITSTLTAQNFVAFLLRYSIYESHIQKHRFSQIFPLMSGLLLINFSVPQIGVTIIIFLFL